MALHTNEKTGHCPGCERDYNCSLAHGCHHRIRNLFDLFESFPGTEELRTDTFKHLMSLIQQHGGVSIAANGTVTVLNPEMHATVEKSLLMFAVVSKRHQEKQKKMCACGRGEKTISNAAGDSVCGECCIEEIEAGNPAQAG